MVKARLGASFALAIVFVGCSGPDPFVRRNPGLKSETWATHSRSGGRSLPSRLSSTSTGRHSNLLDTGRRVRI